MQENLPDSQRPEEETPRRGRFQFSLRAILIVQAVFALVLGSTIMAINYAREREQLARRERVLRSDILLSLENAYTRHGYFQSASRGVKNSDNPMHSWRIEVWYSIGPELFDYDLSKPWNSPKNRKCHLFNEPMCRSPDSTGKAPMTNYVAIVGPGTVWPDEGWTRLKVPRENVNTLMIVEVPETDIHWLEPRDWTIDQLIKALRSSDEPFLAIAVNSEIRTLEPDIKKGELRSLFLVDPDEIEVLKERPLRKTERKTTEE